VGDAVDVAGFVVDPPVVAPEQPNWRLLICQVAVVDEKPEKRTAVTAFAFAPENWLRGTVMVWVFPVNPDTWV
jgi:hypothetical protein